MSLTFVNYQGREITAGRIAEMRNEGLEQERQRKATRKADPASIHKGWRVTGIPAGKLEEAKESHERLRAMAKKAGGTPPEAFDPAAWRCKAKRLPVRSKPYNLQSAAMDCKLLAEKAGWLDVQIQEIKKVVA